MSETPLSGGTMDHANLIFDVLVEECGADERLRDDFRFHWPTTTEYRFQGALGFGGKVWRGPRVNCYQEDATPERTLMIERANERLSQLGRTP